MLIRIDSSKDVSLHVQIAGELRRVIAMGDLGNAGRLPPVRTLASTLGVNMHTVRRAYIALADEGLLELRQGRGATLRQDGRRRAQELKRFVERAVSEADKRGLSATQLAALVEGEL